MPAGRSVWEFGTNGDADDKFRSDYKTRADGLAKDAEKAKEAKDVTFVFVTPRRYNVWPEPELDIYHFVGVPEG